MDLVFLHGPPAVGKLTVARELERLTGHPVFHNHLVVDLLLELFPFGSEPFVRLREQMWLQVFAEAAAAGRSLIFTFAPEPTVPAGFAERAREVVEGAGGRIRFVRLTVSQAEQERRIDLPSRAKFGKLTDVGVLRAIAAGPALEEPQAEITVDTDRLDPAAAAAVILEGLGLQ